MRQPRAKKIAKELSIHGDTRIDNYYWLNNREDKKVIDYLNKENAYTQAGMAESKELQEQLFNEMKARIKEDDMSVPYRHNHYYYYSRFDAGAEYALYCRKKDNLESAEEIMLNVPIMAKGFDYYQIGGTSISPDNRMVAYGVDTVSRRIYTIYFKYLDTGEILSTTIPNTTGSVVWAADNKTVFYQVKDEALRSFKIFKHKLGSDSKDDVEVYHESDETFGCYISRTKSEKYLVIGSYSTVSNEYRILEADNPDGEFRLLATRERDHEYTIAHFGEYFYIVTNWNARNFRLMRTPEMATGKSSWTEVIPHREDVLLESIDIFKDYFVLSERGTGLTLLCVKSWENRSEDHYVNFGEEVYMAYTSVNPDYDTHSLRLGYASLTTPNTVYEYDMGKRVLTVLKQDEVVGGTFSSSYYESKRLNIPAPDGASIPVSLVYRKDLFKKNGQSPLLLYAYGSYGHSMDPYFSSARLSLLDRGFVFAIAHIRGGQDLGRKWYEEGKLLNKMNTFTDFILCADYLIAERFTSKKSLFAQGGSAGGLLMGAVVNMRPDLWKGVIAQVPFVDVVTTMLDETIPLTTGEFDEWGNPKEKVYYDYMKSYSPYDNVEAKAYPAMLVTTGLHDSQVQYWEPAKWVAKLRDMRTNKKPLYLHCNMTTGHGGASGRWKRFEEVAMEYAFLLGLAGKK
jgi:oligopeptidase B